MIKSTDKHIVSPHKDRKNDLARYYKLHSAIYDATRWSFLFGRKALIDNLPVIPPHPDILEVGCGTGQNLRLLEYMFPDARIFGIDLSTEMLNRARNKIKSSDQISLIQKQYGKELLNLPEFDLILFSYTLTMTRESPEDLLQQIYQDLKPGGYIAVVDFHTTPFKWFRRWMKFNHAHLQGHLYPLLQKYFRPQYSNVRKAYLGLWSYFLFIGKRG